MTAHRATLLPLPPPSSPPSPQVPNLTMLAGLSDPHAYDVDLLGGLQQVIRRRGA